MPARVHAILVVKPDDRTLAQSHAERTRAALAEQTRPVDHLSVVICGDVDARDSVAEIFAEDDVTTAPRATTFAGAAELAMAETHGDAIWLLAQDTAPAPDALEQLAAALDVAPSVAIAAPKLVRWDDPERIVSLGVTMTRGGRAVELAAGEYDQGQHDAAGDVMAADIRGALIRTEVWQKLGGIDPGLMGADEGLDLGVRARLAGNRVVLVPAARVRVAGDGVAGPVGAWTDGPSWRRQFSARVAQLQRRLVYAPGPLLPLQWLAILPLAVARSVMHLAGKRPGRLGPEWAAAATAGARVDRIVAGRRRIRAASAPRFARLAPLRVSSGQLRERFEPDPDDPSGETGATRSDLRFFTGGGAWAVLAALVASVIAFPTLLAAPALGGGGLQPLPGSLAQLWSNAWYGSRSLGIDVVGPADPFATVVAVLGTLWPIAASKVLVLLWVLALPLAVLGGWFAATRVTERPVLRIVGAVAWAVSPTFLVSLIEPHPAAMFTHLLLPWLLYTGSVAHRSWSAAGAASLVLIGVTACSPSLTPALIVLWILAIGLASAVTAWPVALARGVWLIVPAAVVALPLVWWQLARSRSIALLADPGPLWPAPQVAPSAAGRLQLLSGFPTEDPGGWAEFLSAWTPSAAVWWVPLLVLPVAVAALAAPFTRRLVAAAVLLGVAALGVTTAMFAAGVSVSAIAGQPVAIWPGSGLSLAWAGMVGAALLSLDTPFGRRLRWVRPVAAGLTLASLLVLAVPQLTAPARGDSLVTNGPASTLPAYVSAEGGSTAIATIVITPSPEGPLSAVVVWGASETLSGHSTAQQTRTSPTPSDAQVAALAAGLASPSSTDVVDQLRADGIGYVLLAPSSPAARAGAAKAQNALDARAGLESVGETGRGELWRVSGDVSARAGLDATDQAIRAWSIALTVLVIIVALLLAAPTRSSRRRSRYAPRVVGIRGWGHR